MVNARLSFAAAFCLLIFVPQADAAAPQALTTLELGAATEAVEPHPAVHSRKKRSFYCYERYHWWFYRPYRTARDGHPRCVPHFHYLEPYRGRGLSHHLRQGLLFHPELRRVTSWMLTTRDAQGLYQKYGFQELTFGGTMWMVRAN